jgi:hypothetical protein
MSDLYAIHYLKNVRSNCSYYSNYNEKALPLDKKKKKTVTIASK